MNSRLIIMVSLATLILGSLHVYIYARISRHLLLAPSSQLALKVVLVLLFAALWAAMPLSRLLGVLHSRWLSYIVFTWLGTMMLTSLGLLFADIVGWLLPVLSRVTPIDPGRRQWLAQVVGKASLVGSGLASVVALSQGLSRVLVKRVTVPIARLPRALAGLRIVQITDVHIGPTLRGDFLRQVVDSINALSPDVVAITGDLVDGPVEALRSHVQPLSEIKSRHGVFFVTGNHEYYAGADAWIAYLRTLGIRVLRNERVRIRHAGAAGGEEGELDVAGVDDYHANMQLGHGADLEKALLGQTAEVPVVLLAHQPIQFETAKLRGVDLQLSGHTHGGQIWPWGMFVRLQQPYLAGLYREGKSALYVSCGTGYWGPPMRLGARAEITELTLVAA